MMVCVCVVVDFVCEVDYCVDDLFGDGWFEVGVCLCD